MSMHPEVSYFFPEHQLGPLGPGPDHLAAIDSSQLWRDINPHLHISEHPFSASPQPLEFSPPEIQRALAQVAVEGYFQTAPRVPLELCQTLSQAVQKIIQAGYHPLYVSLYDEYWQMMRSLSGILEPILGPGCHPLGDFWAWCISPQTAGSGWGPHRDYQFKASTLRPDGRPTLVTCWLPWTDATPLNGCMYLIPMDRDENLPDHPENYHFGGLQDIRALPAPAGSVLAWNQYVMHWGGRCCQFAQAPRIATGIYFQSADQAPYVAKPVDFSQPLPFERRLAFIASNMLNYHQYHGYPQVILEMCFRQIKALANYEDLVPTSLFEMMP